MFDQSYQFDESAGEQSVCRFEDMLQSGNSSFFDVDEFEWIADYYLERNNLNRGEQLLAYALQMYPGNSALLLKQAQLEAGRSNYKRALTILADLEQLEPRNTDIYLCEANIYRQLNNHQQATAYFRKAIEVSDDCEDEIYFDLAMEQESCQDYAGAISSLIQALKINPDNEAALFELAYCYDYDNRLPEAITYLEEFINQQPYNYVAWYNLGNCYMREQRYDEARRAYDYSMLIEPGFASAYFGMGNALVHMESYHEAIATYESVLELHFDQALAYCYIGECYERLEEFELALQHYEMALEHDANMTDAVVGMGIVRDLQGRHTEALSFFRKAHGMEPQNNDYRHFLAESLTKCEIFDEAIEIYENLLAESTDDEEAWDKYARVLNTTIGTEVAIEVLRNALTYLPQSSIIMYSLTRLLLLNKRQSEAEDYLSLALEQNYEGHREFLNDYPDAVRFHNIARLIELYKK